MPPGGFGARGHGKEAVSLLPRSFAADVLRVKKEENKSGHPENVMMDAAHHLVSSDRLKLLKSCNIHFDLLIFLF